MTAAEQPGAAGRAKRLLAGITPGKWEIYRYPTGGGRIFVEGIGNHYRGRSLVVDMNPVAEVDYEESDAGATVYHTGDREFLFAAPDLVAGLLAQNSELDQINEQVHALNRKLVARSVDAEAALKVALAENGRLRAELARHYELRLHPGNHVGIVPCQCCGVVGSHLSDAAHVAMDL